MLPRQFIFLRHQDISHGGDTADCWICRTDERTRTADLLITSEKWGVAWYCSSLLWLAESSYLSEIFFSGLHTIAEHCALGDVEVM
jgi:hypothetical protein